MSGVRMEIAISDGGLGRALERALIAGTDLKPALELSAGVIEENIAARFDGGHGPGGIPWPVSRRAAEQGGKTLVDTGALAASIDHAVRPNEVEVGTRSTSAGDVGEYAATHQYGATIRPKAAPSLVFTGADGGLVFASEVTIPARPFIGFDDQDVADLEDLWAGVLEGAFDGD